MRNRLSLLTTAILAVAVPVRAGVLAHPAAGGVLTNAVSVCFAGDAATTQAAFITRIRSYLQAHQGVANIDYQFLASCSPPTLDASGNEVYAGDLRVVLPGTSEPYSPPASPTGIRMPGIGCTGQVPVQVDASGTPKLDASGNQMDTGSSYGIFPHQRTPGNDTHCRWNLRLGADADSAGVPWRNHTLHEFGHSLGFAHEFERTDARTGATAAGCDAVTAQPWVDRLPSGGAGNTAFTTEGYDVRSTMNYTVPECPGYAGNYSQAGLGSLEQISLHFMYPEDIRVAEFLGQTVLRAGETLNLSGLWEARGASLTSHRMVASYAWAVGAFVLSYSPSLTLPLTTAADIPLSLTYTDFAGRTYGTTLVVRVLPPQAFDQTIAGPLPALALLLGP